MSVIVHSYRRILKPKLSHLFVWCVLLAGPAYGQADQSQPVTNQAPDVLDKLKQDTDDSMYYVEVAAHTGRVDAIPILEKKFVRSKDTFDKAKIAEVLVKLGDRDETYWNFLVGLATLAMQSDAPDVGNFDAQGKSTGLSPKFVAWAIAHKMSPNEAAENAIYIIPGEVGLLGLTGDHRAIPLLRRALQSHNYFIRANAASGLAQLGDDSSIPLIISACKDAPAEPASVIAEALVYFDDPRAQSAVDTYIPKDSAKALRNHRAAGKHSPFDY
jgi:HEAT repeats